MFTAALFTTGKTEKQPMPTDTEIDNKDVPYLYNGMICSHKKA